MQGARHQFVDRHTRQICDERLFHDRMIGLLYGPARERAPRLFRALTSRWSSKLLGFANYDLWLGSRLAGNSRFVAALGIDLQECVEPWQSLDTPRKVFERKIRYWEQRPLPADPGAILSPADSRALVGSLRSTAMFFIKEKFFRFEELLGPNSVWTRQFAEGDFAIFRLTPEKYHYNHAPVSGIVQAIYEVEGDYHSCNPSAVVTLATPYSKNKRVVTIIDTDTPGGSGVGLVAMIEIVALMIGEIVQCYSQVRYDGPRPLEPGMFLERGQPKSLFRPGSSTDVLLFQPGRIEFAADLLRNQQAVAESRFSMGFGAPLVETNVQVRSWLASPTAMTLGDEAAPGSPLPCPSNSSLGSCP
jgi:phosphatidylserine decarboxylase